MSATISFGDDEIEVQVASNRGWIDVADWVEGLPHNAAYYPTLLAFVEHGECADIPAMISEIKQVLSGNDHPEEKSVASTLEGLRDFCKKYESHRYFIMTDGFHSGYEDDDGD